MIQNSKYISTQKINLVFLGFILQSCSHQSLDIQSKVSLLSPQDRTLSSNSLTDTDTATNIEPRLFDKHLLELKQNILFANLHAHHFIGTEQTLSQPKEYYESMKANESCISEHAKFPMDDGRPCRDHNDLKNVNILPRTKNIEGVPETTDYFKQACEYATTKGELDVLFITPHSKDGNLDKDTNTHIVEYQKRQDLLSSINIEINGGLNEDGSTKTKTKYCGLGQEVSSISAGNHLNLFGQFKANQTTAVKPFYFKTGSFNELYQETKARIKNKETIIAEFNHPDVQGDLYWGNIDELLLNKKKLKKSLNDYGLDDYPPLSCMLKKSEADECKLITDKVITPAILQATFRNMRKASGDPFRLIEVISPGNKGEGDVDNNSGANSNLEANGDGNSETTIPTETAPQQSFGATDNSSEKFLRVHNRKEDRADQLDKGIRNWIFYLAMGFKLSPTANQDNHHMNYGSATSSRTGILSPSGNEKDVLNALNKRRTFASEDRNAKIILSALKKNKNILMGDIYSTQLQTVKLKLAYFDPDLSDQEAIIRVYLYHENDALDFSYGADSKNLIKTLNIENNHIRTDQTLDIEVPLKKGKQWVFVQIIQQNDLDYIWSAPIWINRF